MVQGWVATDNLQEYVKSPEFGLGSDHLTLTCSEKPYIPLLCVSMFFLYVLVHVPVLTVTDFMKVLLIDNLCIE